MAELAAVPRVPAALLAVVVGGLLCLRSGLSWELPAYLYLGVLGSVLALLDLRIRRLPDALVLPSYPIGMALLALPALAEQRWPDYGRALLGAAALYSCYLLLALARPAGMGFGDVKLAGVLGLYLGWWGWAEVLVGGFLGFLLGGLAGAALMVCGKARRTSAIPFGPFMLAGALLAGFGSEGFVAFYLASGASP